MVHLPSAEISSQSSISSTQVVLSVEITLSPGKVEHFGDSDVELVLYA